MMLGFSAAIALWAFEFGKDLAGLDRQSKEELQALREQVVVLQRERDKAQSVANTAQSLVTAEKAAQEKFVAQVRQLEGDNRLLRDDLGFFEKLLPGGANESSLLRGLQAERLSDLQMRWQVLVIQPVKNAPTFTGQLDITFSGTLAGKPWMMSLPPGGHALDFKQYRRLEGVIDLPAQAVVKTVTAKVLEGATVRSVQTVKL